MLVLVSYGELCVSPTNPSMSRTDKKTPGRFTPPNTPDPKASIERKKSGNVEVGCRYICLLLVARERFVSSPLTPR